MLKNVVKRQMVVVDISTKISEKINELFIGYSNQYIEKVKFFVWLINRTENGGYQVHQENHKNFFGLSGNAKYSIQSMIQKLEENKIIVRTSLYEVGATSIEYKVVTNYKWGKTEGEVKKYYNDVREFPTFIKKFMVDFYLVKSVKKSNYKKDIQIEIVESGKVNDIEKSNQIEELKKQLEQQNILIQSLQDTIEELKNNKTQNIEEVLNSTIKVEKIEETKYEASVSPYEKYINELKDSGINEFSEIFQLCFNKFIPVGTHEEIEKEISSIIYNTIEEILN